MCIMGVIKIKLSSQSASRKSKPSNKLVFRECLATWQEIVEMKGKCGQLRVEDDNMAANTLPRRSPSTSVN